MTTTVKTFTAEIRHTGPAHMPWCLTWRSAHMSAPAFWYYRTKEEAEHERGELLWRHWGKADAGN